MPVRSSGARTSSPSSRRRGKPSQTGTYGCASSTGEAGIGKSRLIAELAQQVAAAGAPVLYGGCRESPRPPYGPFVDAIARDLRGLDPDAAARRIGTSGGELARIVPDLRDRFGPAAHVAGESPEGEQLRLFGAVGDYLQRTARPRALVVIEDIHWADAGTLALLGHIVRTAGGSILLVVSSRDVAPDLTSALSTFFADIGRHPAVRRIGLSGLTQPDVEALLRATADNAALDVSRTARMLHEATAGSPLFLREIVRELPADGLLLSVPVSATLRDHVAARFERVSDADGAVLDAAAVLGAEFAARTCAQVLDRPLPDVLDALDRAAGLGIVVPIPAAAGRFAFTHAVLREVRYEAIPAGRRMRLHHAAGTVLRAAGAPATDLARHFYASADLGDREDAFMYARRAGELARERFAFADAAVYFEQADQLAAQLPGLTEHDLCELAIERGEALHRAGDPRHRAVLLEAAAAARRLDDADLLTRAALALGEQGWTFSVGGAADDEIIRVTRDALGRLPGDATTRRARLTAMIAATVYLSDHDAGRELGAAALATARASGDPNALLEVLITAHWACFDPYDVEQRLAWAREARELAERLDNPAALGQALLMLAHDRLELGEVASARAAFDRVDRIADQLDAAYMRVYGPANRAPLAVLAGRLDEAERLVSDFLPLARRIGFEPAIYFGGTKATVMVERGLWERGIATLERASMVRPRCRCCARDWPCCRPEWGTPTRHAATCRTSPRTISPSCRATCSGCSASSCSPTPRLGCATRTPPRASAGSSSRSAATRHGGRHSPPSGPTTSHWRSSASCSATTPALTPTSMPPSASASARTSSPTECASPCTGHGRCATRERRSTPGRPSLPRTPRRAPGSRGRRA